MSALRDRQLRRAWTGRRVIVTGASSGIGRAVAIRLLAVGARVAGVARRGDRLAGIDGLFPVVADLQDPVEAARSVADAAAGLGGLDGLVHAAGVALAGPHHRLDPEALAAMYRLHVVGTDALIRAALPRLLDAEARPARLVIVSSGSAVAPSGFSAGYAASKAFQAQLAASLRHEFPPRRLTVTCALVGVTRTEILESDRGFPPWLVRLSDHLGQSPEAVAGRLLADAGRGRARSWPGTDVLRIPGVARLLGRLTALGRGSYGAP